MLVVEHHRPTAASYHLHRLAGGDRCTATSVQYCHCLHDISQARRPAQPCGGPVGVGTAGKSNLHHATTSMQPRWIVSSRWICRVLGLLVGLVLLGLLAVLYQRGANVRMLMEAMMEMRDTEDDDLDAQLLFAQARLKKKNRKAPLAEELLQEAGLMDTILEPKDLPACNTLLANATADFRANGLEALGSRWRAFVQASQNRKLT